MQHICNYLYPLSVLTILIGSIVFAAQVSTYSDTFRRSVVCHLSYLGTLLKPFYGKYTCGDQ